MRKWDHVIEVIIGVTQYTHIVPDNSLRFVAAAANYVIRSRDDAVLTDGGVNVATAEEKAADGGRGNLGDAQETVDGSVGGERREKDRQICSECAVGLEIGSICAGMSAVSGS